MDEFETKPILLKLLLNDEELLLEIGLFRRVSKSMGLWRLKGKRL